MNVPERFAWRDLMRIGWRELLNEVTFVLPPDFRLEPSKTALLLVDIQNTNCNPRMPERGVVQTASSKYPELGRAYADYLSNVFIPNNRELLEYFRENLLTRVFLTIAPERPDGRDMPPAHRAKALAYDDGKLCLRGSYELQVIDELKPRDDELVMNKTTYSAFNSTGIDQVFRNLGIEYLVITGAGTNACVDYTARDAVDRGYKCVLVEDACATVYMFMHHPTLYNFAALLGKVAGTKEVIAELSAAPSPQPDRAVGDIVKDGVSW